MPVTFDDIVGRSRARHGFAPSNLGAKRPLGGARRVREHVGDSFEGSRSSGISSRARTDLHGSRRTWAIHPSLRDAFDDIDARIDEAEIEPDGSGDADVVDCEVIASGAELRRWRLSLTDFHALLAGGTEAIAAYRSEQRRKEAVRDAEAPRSALPLPQSMPEDAASTQTAAAPQQPAPAWGTRVWRTLSWPFRTLALGLSQGISWLSRQILGA